ncbi:MAG TPA: glucokinase [Burkholderiaceae bacterium]|nr:glucokinase [Burkholderiaceae bacterium]
MSSNRGQTPTWLLADVGGTNVRFALAQPSAVAPLMTESIRAYRVADFASLADAARSYARPLANKPTHAVFALAGRVENGHVKMTNHRWSVSAAQLQSDLTLDGVQLINDFAAISMGLPLLQRDDVTALGHGADVIYRRTRPQTFCVLGPGTGLGISALTVRDGRIETLQTEGGHVGFAPTSADEIAILRQLMDRFARVSVERVLCGSGLVNVYQAICAMDSIEASPLAPEEITERARQLTDPPCVRAVEMFCDILGSVAGDCVLGYGAWDGVYLAGGMLAPLLPWLQQGRFRLRFDNKGRFAQAVSRVPVALVTHPQPGLLGAAACAVLACGRSPLRSVDPVPNKT